MLVSNIGHVKIEILLFINFTTIYNNIYNNIHYAYISLLGFTSDSLLPWMSVNNPSEINVAAQLEAGVSRLKTFKELVEARKTLVAIMSGRTNISLLNGTLKDGTVSKNSVLAFTRIKSGNPGVLVAVNPTKEVLTVNFGAIGGVAEELTVHLKSADFSINDLQVK